MPNCQWPLKLPTASTDAISLKSLVGAISHASLPFEAVTVAMLLLIRSIPLLLYICYNHRICFHCCSVVHSHLSRSILLTIQYTEGLGVESFEPFQSSSSASCILSSLIMSDLIREALLGQIIRLVTRNKLLQYPEERADFVLPPEYSVYCKEEKAPSRSCSETSATTPNDLEKDDPNPVHSTDEALTTPATLSRTRSRTATVPFTEERLEIEAELALQRTVTRPIAPQKTADGTILVDWYTTDDPANPQNWSDGKRAFTALQICLYTVAVYTGSAIYTSSETGVMEAFGVSPAEASLPLSLYVLACQFPPLFPKTHP